MSEKNVQNETKLLVGGDKNTRIFRNNVGMAYTGKLVKSPSSNKYLLLDPKPIKFGLANGSADLIGIRKIQITDDMVDEYVGIFVAIEEKKPEWNENKKLTKHESEQKNFLDMIKKFGGIAFFSTSAKAALRKIKNWRFS